MTINNNIQIKSFEIKFNSLSNDNNDKNNKNNNEDKFERFETFKHLQFYEWCKDELLNNEIFNDIRDIERQNSRSSMIIEWILFMINKFERLNGNSFLWHASTENVIIDGLLN